MALSETQLASTKNGGNVITAGSVKATPDKYTALGEFLSVNDINKPQVRELFVKTFGDQGITGFLTLTGATKNAGQADQIEWFEEKRRHRKARNSGAIGFTSGAGQGVFTGGSGAYVPQQYDVLMNTSDGARYLVTGLSSGYNAAGGTATLTAIGDAAYTTDPAANSEFAILGNMYPQGSNQPTYYVEPGYTRRKNPFMIVKEKYEVTGSQATNIGYVNTGNGDYRWFMYGESEARARFMDKRELMLLFAKQADDLVSATDGLAGSEGYISAIEDRGNVYSGSFEGFSDIDLIIAELDKQGAPAEYAMYLNRTFELNIDDMLAQGIATQVTAGLPGQFGAFNNSADLAVQLGFKSFTRGGYTFHKHSWKLLNDPTLLAGSKYAGVMIPMSQVADARTGVKSPALEMNYKASNGYSRELEHWVTGGGVLGYTNNGTDGKDVATFHYRSEVNLITRAANQHFVLKTA
jgi:hypothetical protein